MLNSMNPIFIETDRSRNTTVQMPEATSEWSDFLVNELYKQHPSLSGKSADVHFQNKDEEQGYATGAIKISDNGRLLLNVPFIIEAKRLYPLDVFFSSQIDDEPHPLTEDRIREVFFHSRVMDGLAPAPRAGDLTNAGMYYGSDETLASHSSRVPPASMGIAKWGSAVREENNWFKKLARSLENPPKNDLLKIALDSTVKEDIDDWGSEILSMDGAISIRKMEKNGTVKGLNDIAEADAPPRSLIKYAMELSDTDIETARIKKEGPDKYSAWLSDSDNNITKISSNREETERIIETIVGDPRGASDEIGRVERHGERIISAIRHNPNDYPDLTEKVSDQVFEKAGDKLRKVDVFDPATRASMKGWLIGRVIFPSGKLTGNKMFINRENFAYQPDIMVEYLDGTINDSNISKLDFSYPRAGEMGTFVSQDDEDKGTAIVPFEVLSVITDTSNSDEGMAVRAETVHGNRITLIPSANVLTARPISTIEARKHLGMLVPQKELAYLVPRRFQYVTLGQRKDIASNKEDMSKQADYMNYEYVDVIHDNGLFHLKGGPVDKLELQKWGYLKHSLTPNQALHTLISVGMPGESAVASIKLAECKKKHSSKIKRKPYAALKKNVQTKQAMEYHSLLTKELKEIRNEIRSHNLLKIAAVIPDSATVNTVLSLKFIGPETFHNFSRHIPLLEKTLSFLSTLLLTSRIDSTIDLDEQEISTAIRLMDNTTQKIKKMRAIISPT